MKTIYEVTPAYVSYEQLSKVGALLEVNCRKYMLTMEPIQGNVPGLVRVVKSAFPLIFPADILKQLGEVQ